MMITNDQNTDIWMAVLGDRDAETVIGEFALDPTDRRGMDEWLGTCEAEAVAQGLRVDDSTLIAWHSKTLDELCACAEDRAAIDELERRTIAELGAEEQAAGDVAAEEEWRREQEDEAAVEEYWKQISSIPFSFMDGCSYETGEWTGTLADAVAAAVEALKAEEREDGQYVYHADETDSDWLVDADDLSRLGAALLSGIELSDAYSIWCSETSSEEVERSGFVLASGDDAEEWSRHDSIEEAREEAKSLVKGWSIWRRADFDNDGGPGPIETSEEL